jgi:hypothetical protein
MSVPRLLEIIRKQGAYHNKEIAFLGEVVSVSPLKVSTNGITLEPNNLKILSELQLQKGDEVQLLVTGAFFVVLGKVISP